MKKFICIILCAAALLSLGVLSASGQGRVYVNDLSAQAGETVTVSVMTEYVDACCGGSFNIVYDNTLLELVSCVKGSAMEGITPYMNTDYAENKIRVTWMTGNTVSDGSLCDVQFKVKDSATAPAYVRIEELKLSDIDGTSISAEVSGGYVLIGGGSLSVTDVSLFDYRNEPLEAPVAGSNKVVTEVHNTLSIEAKPLVICALYKNGELKSSSVTASETSVGLNETVTLESVVNVPMASGYELRVVVYDGVLNLEPLTTVVFGGE